MAASSEDRFADFLLSLVGEELPLSTEKQALIVSLLGVYVLFTVLLVLLLSLLGLGSCSDLFCWEWPAICRRSHVDTFVILDEKTDVDAIAYQALVRAEMADGTPRLQQLSGGYYESEQPLGGRSRTPPSARNAFATPSRAAQPAPPPPAGAFVHAPAARQPLSGRGLPQPVPGPLCKMSNSTVPGRFGEVGITSPDFGPPYTAAHVDQFHELQKSDARTRSSPAKASNAGVEQSPAADPRRGHCAPRSAQVVDSSPAVASPAAAGASTARVNSFAARGSTSPGPLSSRPATARSSPGSARSSDWRDSVGWRDKDSPAWYGV